VNLYIYKTAHEKLSHLYKVVEITKEPLRHEDSIFIAAIHKKSDYHKSYEYITILVN